MTTPTKLPIPSGNLLDSKFNFEKLDQIVNSDANYYTDRFGKQRLTVKGLEQLANQISVDLQNNIGLPDGFNFIGQVSSIAQLLLIPGSTGKKVLVKGYNEGSELGGGEFYYEPSLANINDGVGTFNGWVRKITNKTISVYDAGLIPNDGSNARSKLQLLADFLNGTSGWTLEGYGSYQVDGNVIFKNSSFLKITGDLTISGKERRDSWIHQGWVNDELPDAVLYFKNCPYLNIEKTVHVVGAKSWFSNYNPTQTYEMGDCGIRLYNSPHFYISAEVNHCFTWGIYADMSDYGIVDQAHVYDCVRQSGINICSRSSFVSILNCLIHDIGLYGIEAENFPTLSVNTKMVTVQNNTIMRCNKGIAVVGNIERADVKNNTVINCYCGIFTRTSGYSLKVTLAGNQVEDSQIGYDFASSANIGSVPGNGVSLINTPDYLITSQYDAIMKWGNDRTQFYVHGWSPLAQAFILNQVSSLQVWIDGVSYTAISGTRSDSVSLGTNGSISYSALITLSSSIPDTVESYTLVRYILTTGTFFNLSKGVVCRQYNASFPLNNNVNVNGFVITGVNVGITTSPSYSDNTKMMERYVKNTLIDCPTWIRGGGKGIYVDGNAPNVGSVSAFTQGVPNLIPRNQPIQIRDRQKLSTDAPRNKYTTTRISGTSTGFNLVFDTGANPSNTDIVIRINGQVWYTIPAASWNSLGNFNITFNTNIILAESQYITINNTGNDLSYQAYDLIITML